MTAFLFVPGQTPFPSLASKRRFVVALACSAFLAPWRLSGCLPRLGHVIADRWSGPILRSRDARGRIAGEIAGTLPEIDAMSVGKRGRDGLRLVAGSNVEGIGTSYRSVMTDMEHAVGPRSRLGFVDTGR